MLKNNLDKKHSRWVATQFESQALKGRQSSGGVNRRGQTELSQRSKLRRPFGALPPLLHRNPGLRGCAASPWAGLLRPYRPTLQRFDSHFQQSGFLALLRE
jgi:hypothetical protein